MGVLVILAVGIERKLVVDDARLLLLFSDAQSQVPAVEYVDDVTSRINDDVGPIREGW